MEAGPLEPSDGRPRPPLPPPGTPKRTPSWSALPMCCWTQHRFGCPSSRPTILPAASPIRLMCIWSSCAVSFPKSSGREMEENVRALHSRSRSPATFMLSCMYVRTLKKKGITYHAMKMQLDRRTRQTCDPSTNGDHICLVVTKIARTFLDSKWNAHIILTIFVVVGRYSTYLDPYIHTYTYQTACIGSIAACHRHP